MVLMLNRRPPPSLVLALSLMATSLSATAAAQALGQDLPRRKAPATREQVREAVNAHRAAEQEQIQRDEAIAGRRMTPAERAELREQLRQGWAQRAVPVSAVQPMEPAATATQQKAGWSWRSIFFWSRTSPP